MTRGKPSILSRGDRSKKRESAKKESESRFEAGALPHNPPADLNGMPAARAAWRALFRAHDALPGQLFNGLDRGFLVGYCMAVQNRANALALADKITADFSKGEAGLEVVLKTRSELRQSIRLVSDLEKQLYATPKSRAGTSPEARELTPAEIVEREMAELNKDIGEDL